MYLTLALVAVAALASIYAYITRNYNYWKHQNVPSAPSPLPIVGHMLRVLLLKDNLAMWAEKMYERMGKRSMYGCYFVQKPALLIREPELIKSVLQTNFSCFRNNATEVHQDLDPILYKNPFFAKDELWKESRTLLGNNFTGKTLRSVFSILARVCDQFTNYVDRNIVAGTLDFELKDLFQKITGEIVANAAFGIEGYSFEDQPERNAFTNVAKRAFGTSIINGLENALRFCFPSLSIKFGVRLLPTETDLYFRQILQEIIKTRRQSYGSNSDFLQCIINKMGEMDEDMVVAQATSIFFDGYETSSSVLGFVVYRLAEHPEVQQKAREEVLSVLRKYDNQLTYEAIKELNYMEQVMSEAMRLNPGIAELIKTCTEEVTLEARSDELKATIKPGHVVVISVNGVHTDEEFWPDPKRFDPERFDAANKNDTNKYAYLPFGEGPRVCIGKRMAMMVVKTTAAIILKNYLLEVSPRMKLPIEMNPNTFSWVAKDGLWVRFKPINAKDS